MRVVGNVVFRLHLRLGRLHRRIDIAHRKLDLAGITGGFFHGRAVAGRSINGVGSVFPRYLERIATLHCRPGAGCNDRHAAQVLELGGKLGRIKRDHLEHARHLERSAVIERRHRAAVDGRSCNHGVRHALTAHVGAVDGRTRGNAHVVDEVRLTLADVAEF